MFGVAVDKHLWSALAVATRAPCRSNMCARSFEVFQHLPRVEAPTFSFLYIWKCNEGVGVRLGWGFGSFRGEDVRVCLRLACLPNGVLLAGALGLGRYQRACPRSFLLHILYVVEMRGFALLRGWSAGRLYLAACSMTPESTPTRHYFNIDTDLRYEK
jgi:hypothetical protein